MRKVFKTIGILLLVLVLLAVLLLGGYVLYLTVQYSRIPDYTPVETLNTREETLRAGEGYSAVTFNIGFGAYDPAFSFFMDEGTMNDGTAVRGKSARAASEAVVRENTRGALETLANLGADFMLLQEVDQASDRSYGVNQVVNLQNAFGEYSSVYASNFHTPYLLWPPTDPIGRIESGVVTLARYRTGDSIRRSYPVDDSFPTKFFDLDRCFTVTWVPVEGGEGDLVLINTHMSAYDEGGLIRAAQLQMLASVMQEERAKGNYVIVGGDFNHALGVSVDAFASGQRVPDWVVPFEDSLLPEGFSIVHAGNNTEVATCRSSDMAYTPGVNYTTVLDGFIVSDNVEASATNIDAGFVNSDHNPVLLQFVLRAAEEEGEQ